MFWINQKKVVTFVATNLDQWSFSEQGGKIDFLAAFVGRGEHSIPNSPNYNRKSVLVLTSQLDF